MNPWQAWKAKLEGALFLGIHNREKTVCGANNLFFGIPQLIRSEFF